MDIKKGEILVFHASSLKMHNLGCEDIISGDKIKIIRQTRKGTFIGRNLRTDTENGGFVKKDFKKCH